MSAWQPYRPSQNQPWDLRRVAHLHRRAVFGPTWSEVLRDLSDSPEHAVDRVLSGDARSADVPTDFTRLADLIGDAAAQQTNPQRLKAAWIYRVLFTPDPLGERLTFMWHSHFATSNLKVQNLLLMKQQNDSLRRHARAPFGDLLRAMLDDPALLQWLDAPVNRLGQPNENLGRELLELFTLGIGNYTESDVKNAARALTGLNVKQGRSVFDQRRHDAGEKSILGSTEPFNPQRLVDLLLDHPATAARLATRLIGEFFGEGVVSGAAKQELSDQLRNSKLDIGSAVETILRSNLFFSDDNIGSRVSDPLSFLVAPLRALEHFRTPPSTLGLAVWLRRMGLDLYYPPNVAGWPGGRHWLTTRTVIARSNYAAAIAAGTTHRPPCVPEMQELRSKYAEGSDQEFRKIMQTLLLGDRCDSSTEAPAAADSSEANTFVQIMTNPRVHLH